MKKFIGLLFISLLFLSCQTTKIEEPKSKDGIYAVGFGESKIEYQAIDFADIDAKSKLSDKMGVDVNTVIQFLGTNSNIGYEKNVLQKSHNIIEGYEIKRVIKKKGRIYYVQTTIFLPFENKIENLKQNFNENSKATLDEAYSKYFEE